MNKKATDFTCSIEPERLAQLGSVQKQFETINIRGVFNCLFYEGCSYLRNKSFLFLGRDCLQMIDNAAFWLAVNYIIKYLID